MKNATTLFIISSCSLFCQPTIATDHTDNSRLAVVTETFLKPSNLATFRKLATIRLAGKPYSQVLYIPSLTVGGSARNVIFSSDNTNTVYAHDADSFSLLWATSTGETPCSSSCTGAKYNLNYGDPVGVFSTPAVDVSNGWIFFVTLNNSHVFKLWKVNLLTGATIGSSSVLTASVSPSTAPDAVGGTLTFAGSEQQQRTGITIANGNVYVGFGSANDQSPWHGWIMARKETDLSDVGDFCSTINTVGGGLWMSGSGFAVLPNGNLIAVTGNGTPNSTSYNGTTEFSMSVLQLSPALSLLDWYTPANYSTQNANDTDLGSSHPMLIPNPASAGNYLIVTGGKDYNVYSIHSECMGHLGGTVGGCPGAQVFATGTDAGLHLGIYGDAHMNGVSYFPNTAGSVFAFALQNTGLYDTTPVTGSSSAFPGAMLGGSINGTSAALLWVIDADTSALNAPSNGELVALNASTLAAIWSSGTLSTDSLGSIAKFKSMTVANGKVYVPTYDGNVQVYGLSPSSGLRGQSALRGSGGIR